MSIRILPPQTAAKIAAGEVIIRPASVIKELVENSLDAGADRIDVFLENGGKTLLKVTDNGQGIPADEVELAVRRFATSKLDTSEDLQRISSYGFRGEALASMSEVCKMTVETQVANKESGIMLRVSQGKLLDKKECIRTVGTTITIKDLFFNLPARKSFLKTENYERRLILSVIQDYALLHHKVRFEVSNPKRVLASYIAQENWLDRIKKVYPDLSKVELIEINASHKFLNVKGVVVRPDQTGELKKKQRTFFNSRPVQYRSVYRAVIEGFGPQHGNIPPFFILALNAPPEMLDVNIHPAKTEVRYRDERFLFDFVSQAVRKAVHTEAINNLSFPPPPTETPKYLREFRDETKRRQLSIGSSNSSGFRYSSSSHTGFSPTADSGEKYTPPSLQTSAPSSPHTGFWQLQGLYILAQTSSGLIIVDQHAAHERILYEEMLEELALSPRQPLLFPIILDLSPEEFATFEDIREVLKDLGMEVKEFGPNQIIIETLPADSRISPIDMKELFQEFQETNEVKLGNRDKIAALIACKAAIKAGKILSTAEMESLINRLFRCKAPYFCPHGRPTVIKFSMQDLDKRFGRL